MDDEYARLRLESGRCSDRHYQTMSRWISSMDSAEMRENAGKAATAYEVSLNRLLNCLKRFEPSPERQKRIEGTMEYKRLLEADLSVLGTSHVSRAF